MRKTKEEAEQTRQKLMKVGLAVLSRKGYADTRLEDIALEAGVTRGAIYHHFGSKAELYNLLHYEMAIRINEIVQNSLEEGGTTLEILNRLFVNLLMAAATDSDIRAISELAIYKTAITEELRDGIERKIAGNRSFVIVLEKHIEKAIAEGEICQDIVPHDAAIMWLALQNGLLSLWLLDSQLFSLANRAQAMADIFIEALINRA